MEEQVGVLRDKDGLEKAIEQLTPLAAHSGMALVGLMIATAALHREESRGAHCRTDFPAQDAKLLRHSGGMYAGMPSYFDRRVFHASLSSSY